MYIAEIFKSNYCKVVFVVAFFVGFALLPKSIFIGMHRFLAGLFLILFAFSMTCIVRNVKERIDMAHKHKASTLSVIAAAIGITAFQVCGVSAHICGVGVGAGILSVIFPAMVVNFFNLYSIWIIAGAITIQLVSLYLMGCFRVREVGR